MDNPCRTCHRRYLDKDHPECENCQKRLAYLGTLGGHFPDPIYHGYADHPNKEQTPMGTVREKVCSHSKCKHKGQPQPATAFYKSQAQPDGLDFYCRDCRKGDLLNSAPAPSISKTGTVNWVIDKDIPLPPVAFIRTPRLQLPFERMEPGNSVLVSASLISKNYKHLEAFRNSVAKQARARGYKAATRQIGKDVRVWLVNAQQ